MFPLVTDSYADDTHCNETIARGSRKDEQRPLQRITRSVQPLRLWQTSLERSVFATATAKARWLLRAGASPKRPMPGELVSLGAMQWCLVPVDGTTVAPSSAKARSVADRILLFQHHMLRLPLHQDETGSRVRE